MRAVGGFTVRAFRYDTGEEAEASFHRVRELAQSLPDPTADHDKAVWRCLRNGEEWTVVVYDGPDGGELLEVEGGEPVQLTFAEASTFVTRHLRVLMEEADPDGRFDVTQRAHYGVGGARLTPDGGMVPE